MGKKICILMIICLLVMGKVDVKAVTYAYSIGTKWSDTLDYTGNVIIASAEYMCIDNLISYHIMKPTGTYIRSNNPNGNRIIASKLVFLNGQANYQRFYFNHMGNSTYMTGVCTGNDKVSEGYTFAGLASTDMSTCKVITFAGCYTGDTSEDYKCLAEKAVARGAKTAVGWRDLIYTTSPEGEDWLYIYNNSLATGNTVSESIRAAANEYPNDEMTTLVQIAGDPTRVVATASLEEEATYLQLDNVIDQAATEFSNKEILDAIKVYDESINLSDYKVSVNMFDPVNGDGYVIFTYYLDGEIQTSKSYICHIEGNQLSYITDTVEENTTVSTYSLRNSLSEEEIISKVNNHKEEIEPTIPTENLVNLEEYKVIYYYDYETNILTQREYTAVNDCQLDVVTTTYNETSL